MHATPPPPQHSPSPPTPSLKTLHDSPPQAAFFMEERDALVFAKSSEWITTLYAAFQDDENLYLVMEYASGGSLRALMYNRESPMLEDEARFYVAEMMLALDELHRHDFIHRDVKPENCLIDASGHIKLADFGSCIRMGASKQPRKWVIRHPGSKRSTPFGPRHYQITSHETVGTPDYISPEILRAQEGKSNYGRECDWWSLGVIMYELLYEEGPFDSDSLTETYGKIMDHEQDCLVPGTGTADLSSDPRCCSRRLICKQETRLGRNGSEEIRSHPWFKGIDWDNLRKSKPPFIPELSGPDDTRYFEDEENESKKVAKKPIAKTKEFAGQNLPFIGYTY
ncbi:kinase-like domain-containing protein, partial [Blyttiomyces helicus]